jgi:alpha-beta hydrolase superfamily lysophospholipase
VKEHTASDGYRWRYRHYQRSASLAADAAQTAVVCIHGIQSHGGWYEASCRHLAEAGFSVFFLDRRGSGLNEQARGDTPSFRRLLDDIAEFLRRLRESPAGKVLMVAISWGGKLAAALQRRHPGLVDALALVCPGFCPGVRLTLGTRLRILWSRLVAPRRLFPVPLSDPELFTATPRWLQFLRDDPLALHQATARFLVQSVRLDLYLRRVPRHVRLPILLLLAGKDRIIDNAPTRAHVEQFATPDSEREVIEYPEAHHTLEFEPEPGAYFADLTGWLQRYSR